MTESPWTRKDLLGIAELSVPEIELLLATAESFAEVAERPVKKVPTLRGKTVVNLFFEPSTRTRVSFEIAAQRLSADVVNFGTSGSSQSKGETLADTARNIASMAPDFVVVRHPHAGVPAMLDALAPHTATAPVDAIPKPMRARSTACTRPSTTAASRCRRC